MEVTLGQQYNVGERPTVILYTYINRHTRPPNATKTKDNTVHDLKGSNNAVLFCFFADHTQATAAAAASQSH